MSTNQFPEGSTDRSADLVPSPAFSGLEPLSGQDLLELLKELTYGDETGKDRCLRCDKAEGHLDWCEIGRLLRRFVPYETREKRNIVSFLVCPGCRGPVAEVTGGFWCPECLRIVISRQWELASFRECPGCGVPGYSEDFAGIAEDGVCPRCAHDGTRRAFGLSGTEHRVSWDMLLTVKHGGTSLAEEFHLRQNAGREHYGTTVEDNPLPLPGWIEHAREEMMDTSVYLRRALESPGIGKRVRGSLGRLYLRSLDSLRELMELRSELSKEEDAIL